MRWMARGLLLVAANGAVAQEVSDCWLATPGSAQGVAAKCRVVDVPLGDAAEPTIALRVGVLPASSKRAEDDAVFFLAGGPGQAATEAFPQLAGVFSRLNATRDIVLVDQRGTGGSAPLDCPLDAEEMALQAPEDIDLGALSRECLEGLEHDPRYFLTRYAAADLEAVRQALGYGAINLVGVSYGTRLAQRYAQLYPEHVRSIILDGVVPNDLALGFEHAINLDASLQRLFVRCAEDAACSDAFGDVAASFSSLREWAESRPELTVRQPRTGAAETVPLDHNVVAFVARLLSYASESQALLPLLIHQAVHEDDAAPLAAQALMMASSLGQQISRGLEMAIMCAEDVPEFPADHQGDDSVLGRTLIDGATAQCADWPRATVDPARRQPLTLDVPVLLLSGSEDPVTPPRYGDAVAAQLPNALHLVATGHGHNVLPRGCIPKIATEFIEQGAHAELDTSCMDVMGPMPFFVRATGPQP